MSRQHSFIITLSNNVTEKEGVKYLLENHTGFFKIDLPIKKELLDLFGVDHKFLQSFDLIYIPRLEGQEVNSNFIETNKDEIIFVELKTTKKYLPLNPKGFFFGATKNEFDFADLLGEKFRFCFVSLNDKGSSFSLQTIDELNSIIKNKRIQYQINL
jgi:hypothetical protein